MSKNFDLHCYTDLLPEQVEQLAALYDLWQKPGQGWKTIAYAYGYPEMSDLLTLGLVQGERKLGSALELSKRAVMLLINHCGCGIREASDA